MGTCRSVLDLIFCRKLLEFVRFRSYSFRSSRCLPSMSIDLVVEVCSLEDPVDASLFVRKKTCDLVGSSLVYANC